MSNPHPGTTTRRYSSEEYQQSNTPKPGLARKSPTVLRLENDIEKLQKQVRELREELAKWHAAALAPK